MSRFWFRKYQMPPLYPNIVTLRSGALIDDQINAIDPLLPSGWGIKDSYSELELEGKGFALAFDAHWFCRLPSRRLTTKNSNDFQLETVQAPAELNRWVAAWGERSGIIIPSLLENSTVELIYVERDGKVVCGLATNLSGNCIGISNAFGSVDDILDCVALIMDKYPMKTIVGYDGKAEVTALSTIGFKAIGDLRVWLRD